jgi:hypothetical protein
VLTVGFLASGTASSHGRWVAAFAQRLNELGWVEGRTITINSRWAEGRNERAAEIASEFVRQSVDVIVTTGTPTTLAANRQRPSNRDIDQLLPWVYRGQSLRDCGPLDHAREANCSHRYAALLQVPAMIIDCNRHISRRLLNPLR